MHGQKYIQQWSIMLSLAALHAEGSSALIFPVSRSTQSIIYYAERYSGWQYWVHRCSRLYCRKGFFCVSTPPKSILGTPFQKNALKSFCLKGEVLATHCFLLTSRSLHPHTAILVPSCSHPPPPSITAFLLCCRPGEILQCRKATSMMQAFSFPPGWTI